VLGVTLSAVDQAALDRFKWDSRRLSAVRADGVSHDFGNLDRTVRAAAGSIPLTSATSPRPITPTSAAISQTDWTNSQRTTR
jgi:hypothetical protein